MAVSEQEQAERLKTWWKKNAVPVLGGVLLGFGAIGGYNWWSATGEKRSEAASDLFAELVDLVAAESARIAEEKAAAEAAAEAAGDEAGEENDGDDAVDGDSDAEDDGVDGESDGGDAGDGDVDAVDGDSDAGDDGVDGDSDGDDAGDGDSDAGDDGVDSENAGDGDVDGADGDSDAGDDGVDGENDGNDAADALAQQLREEFGGLDYAAQAALLVARLEVERGDLAAARGHLRWVVDNAAKPATGHAARVRLGRLLLAEGDVDGAEAMAAVEDEGGFVSHYAELRGDIFAARENFTEARAAYERALGALPAESAYRGFLELKINNSAGPAQ